jgi:thiosulfate dehydrogenase
MNQRNRSNQPRRLRETASMLFCLLLSACGSSAEPSAVEQGQKLFESEALSPSHLNLYTCATCHDGLVSTLPLKKTGSAMPGVTQRPVFWGGQERDLLGAINACRNYFMVANQPLAATDADARSLYAYLASLEPGDSQEAPFTIVTDISVLPRGDASNGQLLFDEACRSCHGDMHQGTGKLGDLIPTLPEDTLAAHAQYTPRDVRLVFTEKIRHGLFLGYGGMMPPFSVELLSDGDVSDLLEALGVLGE